MGNLDKRKYPEDPQASDFFFDCTSLYIMHHSHQIVIIVEYFSVYNFEIDANINNKNIMCD